jgi:predicted dehydrogenase
LALDDGVRASITASAVNLLGDEGVRVVAAFYGEEGSLEIDHRFFGMRSGAVIWGTRKGETSFGRLPIPPEYLERGVDPTKLFDPYIKQSAGPRLFIDSIVHDHPVEPDFTTGARVQAVVDGALRSSVEDRWVSIGE